MHIPLLVSATRSSLLRYKSTLDLFAAQWFPKGSALTPMLCLFPVPWPPWIAGFLAPQSSLGTAHVSQQLDSEFDPTFTLLVLPITMLMMTIVSLLFISALLINALIIDTGFSFRQTLMCTHYVLGPVLGPGQLWDSPCSPGTWS